MAAQKLEIARLPIELEGLDELGVDALVLAPFQDERPLRGVSGYCDWRLNGRLSRYLKSGEFGGKPRELMLTDTLGLIGTARVFLFGQGKRIAMDLKGFERAMGRIVVTMKRAGMKSYALELPGTEPGPVSISQAISAFVDVAAADYAEGRVTLFSPNARFSELVIEITSGDRRVELV